VVVGDDPWSDSTQVPTDSRFLSRHLHIPVLEPSTFQEIKDWVKVGLDLSQRANLFVTFLVTTNLADGGGTVLTAANHFPDINSKHKTHLNTAEIPVEKTVILSPRTAQQEETIQRRYQDLHAAAREFGVNQLLYPTERKKPIGFITSGLAYWYLEHALSELGLSQQIPILKLGVTFPVDPDVVKAFAKQVDEIYVIEEKRSFIESQVSAILTEAYQTKEIPKYAPIWGKVFPNNWKPIPETRGLNASLLIERLAPVLSNIKDRSVRLDQARMKKELDLIQQTLTYSINIPARTPSFCPGCPHRDSSSVFKEIKEAFLDEVYMRKHHGRGPLDLVFHGDTGCYTMLMFEPNKDLMHDYSGMGLGAGTGAGISPFITNKQVVFMGDSTFFHSGMIAISDAIKHHQDITIVILDNDTTAMTGHQQTPGTDRDEMGQKTFAQDIEHVVGGMSEGAGIPVTRINPAYRDTYKRLVENTVLQDGVKVIIADKECGITYHRKVSRERKQTVKEQGYLPKQTVVNITPEVCEFCLECTRMTGCPGLTTEETHYGTKIVTDLTLCVSDGACARVKACPSFEEIDIIRKKSPDGKMTAVSASELSKPAKRSVDAHWRAYLAGVGGMGIGVATAILVRAGMREGYEVRFADKKGLAIRNGGVYSHITYSPNGDPVSPITPYGKADLLIGLDLLESVRSIDPSVNLRVGSPERTTAIMNTNKTHTVTTLMGKEDFNPTDLEKMLKRYTKASQYFGANLSDVSERLLGSKLFANIMLLGIAYQRGELPLELENIEWAIRETVRRADVEDNLTAFNIGRHIAVDPTKFITGPEIDTYESVFQAKQDVLSHRRGGKHLAGTYKELVEEALGEMKLEGDARMHFALCVYDLMQYENAGYAQRFIKRVKEIYHKDSSEYAYKATQAAIRYLHKVMLIKDEVYVAHLLTSEEKLARDRARYNVDPKRGDRVVYRHTNRPQFTFLKWDIEFDLTTQNWQLNIMKHFKFLRNILPGWHAREKAFCKWYETLVDAFTYSGKATYDIYVEVLKCPEEVRGYRKIRYPKMDEAIGRVERLLSNTDSPAKTPVEQVS